MPEQWSAASSSQAPPCEAPVQRTVSAAKVSSGQPAPEPEQNSATSHCPAGARHSVVEEAKTSTQEASVPEQWSAASSSQAPPCEAPVQRTVSAAKASSGQAAPEPEQNSATSHCPAGARHSTSVVSNWQVTGLQHGANGASHCSPASRTESPQTGSAASATTGAARSVDSNPQSSVSRRECMTRGRGSRKGIVENGAQERSVVG